MYTDGVETYTGEWKEDAMHGKGVVLRGGVSVAYKLRTPASCVACTVRGRHLQVCFRCSVHGASSPVSHLGAKQLMSCVPVIAGKVCSERVQWAGRVRLHRRGHIRGKLAAE